MAFSGVDVYQVDPLDLEVELQSKIHLGEKLLSSLSVVAHVQGYQKLTKRLLKEIKFLRKVLKKHDVKIEHVKCTNLCHLEALVNCVLQHSTGCVGILETLELKTCNRDSKRVCVDVIADDGQTWIKVVARNPKALSLLSAGEGEYGQRTVTDQAREFLACASQHPYHFKVPKVAFFFASGIEIPLAISLEKLGLEVRGGRVEKSECPVHIETCDTDFEDLSDSADFFNGKEEKFLPEQEYPCIEENENGCSAGDERLNLDVTAMIAYVSALTNGGCNFKFKEPLLSQQAEWERERPAKPFLDKLFEGRKLFCCSTAHKDFKSIMETLGGPNEKIRAEMLLQRVTVVPDKVSKRTEQNLKEGGKVKPRSRKIFGTGDELRAITVTANEGFVRAAKSQGLSYAVLVHESRALSESKETFAEPI